MSIDLRFNMMTAYDEGERRHAQQVMRDLGIAYQHATPQSMGDQWWFWNCENAPAELPKYLEPLGLDPLKQIGWGLDEAEAAKIAAYPGRPAFAPTPRP